MAPVNKIRVVHVCWADDRGGAFIGSRRLHEAFTKDVKFDSRLLVLHKFTTTVPNVYQIKRSRYIRKLYTWLSAFLRRKIQSKNDSTRSFNLVPTGLHHQINEIKPDIVQLHWIGNDTLSIWEIKKINAPIVWKLPDMWAFSGCAHYTLPGFENWYSNKKNIKAGLPYDSFCNFEAFMIRLKKIAFHRANISFVGPSSWITNLVQHSYLHSERRARHIINPIDTTIWKRQLSSKQREKFNLNQNDFIVITSSMNALSDPRKGYIYMEQILKKLKSKKTKRSIKLAVIGQEGQQFEINGVKCIPLGKSYDEAELASLYNVGDAYIFPSTMDNLANTLKEATCCGLPCVAFNIGGNSDMVVHGRNGYLIEPFDTDEFADRIVQLESMPEDEFSALSMITEQIAHKVHDQSIASNNYYEYYTNILREM